MPDAGAPLSEAGGHDAAAILGALPFSVIVLDEDDGIVYVNSAAEQFFHQGAPALRGRPMGELLPPDSPLFSLITQVRSTGASVSGHDLTMSVPRARPRRLTVQAAPFGDNGRLTVLSLQERSIAQDIDRQLGSRNAARSVSALAAMLAHEVKNPLSGIRGAAQLLEQTAGDRDRALTRLICEESDRICSLVDRMDVFTDSPTLDRTPVNIHEVLERVRRIAAAGFGRDVRFVEIYDPSLPAVYGDKDQLIQLFLNLVKNAAEAAPAVAGEIILRSAYRHGLRLAIPGGERRLQLPLEITVQDNGPGIPEDLHAHLFDPFVTTKTKGSGLGLALVAKLVEDHGGVIEFRSEPGRTQFRVLLPMAPGDAGNGAETGS